MPFCDGVNCAQKVERFELCLLTPNEFEHVLELGVAVRNLPATVQIVTKAADSKQL